jgi:Spy/CpxP family protein refolding chaperone
MKDAVESLGRVRVQGILLLVIVFIAGGVAGALVDRANPMKDRRPLRDRIEKRLDGPGEPGGPGEFPGFFRNLDLTDTQREQMRAIFEKHRPTIDSLMNESMPKIRALRDSADAEISALLTPEQREKFEKLSPRFRFPMGDFRRPFDSGDGGGMRRRGPGPR